MVWPLAIPRPSSAPGMCRSPPVRHAQMGSSCAAHPLGRQRSGLVREAWWYASAQMQPAAATKSSSAARQGPFDVMGT